MPKDTRQLVVVRSATWTTVQATLRRFERVTSGAWQEIGTGIPANVGRHGMAWGRGLQRESEDGPVKQEGDAKAPAGVFLLGSAFGYEDKAVANGHDYPYIHLHKRISCIEDVSSPFYNKVLDVADAPGVKREHRSDMRRPDGLFRTGVIVGHNAPPPAPGAGSCVFLHIWRGAGQGTAGCTAMQPAAIDRLVEWLRPDARPVLVQLPDAEYERVKSAWGLPD